MEIDFGVDDYEYITWDKDVEWLIVSRNSVNKKPIILIQNNVSNITRKGHIWFLYGTNTQMITITQTGK